MVHKHVERLLVLLAISLGVLCAFQTRANEATTGYKLGGYPRRLTSPSVYYLDVSALWDDLRCDLEDPTSHAAGVLRLAAERYRHYAVHHSLDQHNGPWFLGQALRSSNLTAPSLANSTLVYVDAHCHITWYWRSRYLTPQQVASLPVNPEAVLKTVLSRVAELVGPRRAVYYFPGPYNAGCAANLSHGHMIVCEAAASCGPPNRTLIAPYNSNLDAPPSIAVTGPRQHLLTFVAGSSGDAARSAGMLMRAAAMSALQDQPGVFIRSSCLSCPSAVSHAELMEDYRSSTFCLVLPGDTQGSRRATEVVVHGCIPVFAGPPFNSMPLASYVDYQQFAVVVAVRNTSAWKLTEAHERQLAKWRSAVEPQFAVESLQDVHGVLVNFSVADVARMQGALSATRSAFIWKTRLDGSTPGAADHLVAQLLHWAADMEEHQEQEDQRPQHL